MLKIFLYVSVGLILLFLSVKFLEERGIYFPISYIDIYPKDIGLKYQDLYIKTKDNLLINAWFIPKEDSKYLVLFCHGNAGNISHRLEKVSFLYNLGLSILIFDYRGYGKSQGKPKEDGFYKDTESIYEFLVNEYKILPERIILYGESLGTAVAIELASKRKVKALILEGAFSRGKDMAKRIYPFLPNFFFSNSFDSLNRIKKITSPKLFLHSKDDEIVPFSLAKKLFDAAPPPKKLVELTGDHNSCFLDAKESYLLSINNFIKELQ
ncbi:MAG: alpha/beta hydrolase [Candidatus Omnitrophica bacterium]|nr:alpha/beta hydrolase [Candidatus Omnitrophota bacterium]